ncbi:MAG: Holliday junction branch migration protein RuvA [Magnetococcales bacterium]|nr:Holliday junction branch migration protein RuvA [Magnetococcales bacterium]
MIAHLQGTVQFKDPETAVIDIQGVGYRAFISGTTYAQLPAIGETCRLLTVTHVREDAIHLIGFHTDEERRLFLLLNSVSGIGTRLALAALSALPSMELAAALRDEDLTTLTRIQGVGKKTAQRMVMELKEKVTELVATLPESSRATTGKQTTSKGNPTIRQELHSALINLGYKKTQADQAVRTVMREKPSSLESALTMALQALA